MVKPKKPKKPKKENKDKIKVKIISSNNVIQSRSIAKKTLRKDYIKTKEGTYRKKVPVIVHRKKLGKVTKIKSKKIKVDEYERLESGELRKKKVTKAKVKTKEVKEFKKKCGFNYSLFYKNVNDKQGYVKEKSVNFKLYDGMSDSEIKDIYWNSLKFLEIESRKLKCPQRFYYFRYYYYIQASNNLDDINNTSWSTKIHTIPKSLKQNIKSILYKLIGLVQTYKDIQIYRFELTNFGIKHIG